MRSLRTLPLLLRHALSNVGASVLVAVIVLLVTFVVAAAPRALTTLSTAELHNEVDALSVVSRDVTNSGSTQLVPGPGDVDLPPEVAAVYGSIGQRLAEIGNDTPPLLDSVLGEPDYFGITEPLEASDAAKSGEKGLIAITLDPHAQSRIRMVEGTFPATQVSPAPLEIILTPAAADEMQWVVGEERTVPATQITMRLSGTFEPVDPTADFWQHAPALLEPGVFDDGNAPRTITGTAFIAPLSVVSGDIPLGFGLLHAWYPVDTDVLDVDSADRLRPQLRKFVATVHQVPSFGSAIDQPFNLTSETVGAIDGALARTTATTAVLGMAVSGPLGVVLAVFALGARSVVDRRRPALTLAAARGASPLQVRGAMALEGLVLGLAPGVIGIVVAVLLVPSSAGVMAVVPALLLALAPAFLFALAGEPSGMRTTRSDLDPRSRGTVRLVVEVLVVLLAAVALFLLVRRGLVTSVSSTGVDPLLTATPLLLSLAACIGVLRLYPYPLLAIHRRLQRSRRVVGFIGSGRAVRDPAVGISAALAIVVAVSVAVFSATLLTTLDNALETSARSEVGGGDLRINARYLLDNQVAALADVDGIAVLAGIDDQGSGALRIGTKATNVELLTGQTSALAAIRGDVPASLDERADGAIPIVISDDLAEQYDGTPDGLVLQGQPVVVAGVLPADSGLGQNANWVLVDTAFITDLGDFAFAPQLLIATTTPDAAPATVANALAAAAEGVTVTSYDDALATTQGSPTVGGLRVAFLLAILAVSLLAAVAVVLSSVIGSPSRNRMLGSLRTLGLSNRQAGALVSWELAPVVITALVAGTLLGLGLPYVVTSTVDLSAFTGGAAVTTPHYDPVVVGGVLGVVVVVTAVASVISVVLSLRRTPASTVKIGAD